MSQSSTIEEGIEYAKSLKIICAITLGDKGSVIVNNNDIIEIEPIKVDKVVDTTGAGDLFASGFLFGMSRKKELKECGHLASVASAEVISHYGARPLVKLSSLI